MAEFGAYALERLDVVRNVAILLSCYGDCSVHPRMVGALVRVGASHAEPHSIGGVLVHVPRIEATCPRRNTSRCHGMRNWIIICPSDAPAFRDRYAGGDVVETLRVPDSVGNRNVHCAPACCSA